MNFVNNYVYPVTSGITAGAATSIASSTIGYFRVSTDAQNEIKYNHEIINLLNGIDTILTNNGIDYLAINKYNSESDLANKRIGKFLCCFECCKCFNQRKNFENSCEVKNKAVELVAKHILDYVICLEQKYIKNNKQVLEKRIKNLSKGVRDEFQLYDLLVILQSNLSEEGLNLKSCKLLIAKIGGFKRVIDLKIISSSVIGTSIGVLNETNNKINDI